MVSEDVAAQLLERAVDVGQASRRLEPEDDVPEIRAAVRRRARDLGVGIRTGLIEDALVVVRVDADLWNEPASQMRRKLGLK